MEPLLSFLRIRSDIENELIASVDWSTLLEVRDATAPAMTPLADIGRAVRERLDAVTKSE